jgi:hypothetical protein
MKMSLNRSLLVSFIAAATGASAALAIPTSVPDIATTDSEKITPAADANSAYTPLLLPKDAAERGISLSGDTKMYRVEQGKYQMGCGCSLIHTEEPIYISTCRANVMARAGATLVVGAKKDVTRVLNLSDRKHDSVRVIFGKNYVSLNPGEELAIVCAKASDADKASSEYVIRYRNAQKLKVSPDYNAVLFEFSLADAMKHCLIFKQLTESPYKCDKLLLNEIIKTAAAVNTLYHSRTAYSHGDTDSTSVASTTQPKKTSSRLIAKKKSPRIALGTPTSTDD